MSVAPSGKPPFDLKSTSWVLTALRLRTADIDAIAAALEARFAGSPGLFDDEPLVIDLSPLRDADAELDFPALLAQLRRHGMLPVAAQGGGVLQMAAARAAGLAEAMEPEPRPEPRVRVAEAVIEVVEQGLPVPPAPALPAVVPETAAEPLPAALPQPPPTGGAPTLVLDKPLRSGQRVYARGGDLVVLSAVSFGAEVIADGNIHVYGPLRGRAIAGARGDTEARIFSTCMEPQLVSIAGIYRTTESPLPDTVAGKPAQVRLDGEKILVEPLHN